MSLERLPRGRNLIAAITLVAFAVGMIGPSPSVAATVSIPAPASGPVSQPPPPSDAFVGTCTRVGNITLAIHGPPQVSSYFVCSDAPTITSGRSGTTVTFDNGTSKMIAGTTNAVGSAGAGGRGGGGSKGDPSSNLNFDIKWSSGGCATSVGPYCTDSIFDENNVMIPNTPGWSYQDNAYGQTGCGDTLNYQNVPNQGTSVNNYNNKWGVAYVKYPNFCTPTITEQFYSVLSGTNLNSNSGFETWFTLTNGSPTTAWLQVSYNCGKHGCTVKTYSAALPSGNPNVAIDGWEGVTVCDFNGCNTNFSPGSQGQFAYYQKNMVVSSPNTSWYTSETSNCIYGSVSQPLSYEGYQSDTC